MKVTNVVQTVCGKEISGRIFDDEIGRNELNDEERKVAVLHRTEHAERCTRLNLILPAQLARAMCESLNAGGGDQTLAQCGVAIDDVTLGVIFERCPNCYGYGTHPILGDVERWTSMGLALDHYPCPAYWKKDCGLIIVGASDDIESDEDDDENDEEKDDSNPNPKVQVNLGLSPISLYPDAYIPQLVLDRLTVLEGVAFILYTLLVRSDNGNESAALACCVDSRFRLIAQWGAKMPDLPQAPL